MARDRKRAKQRRDRGRAPAGRPGSPVPAEGGLERVDVPGALDHASADVDEFDAAIVRGAGGQPVDNELAESAFGAEENGAEDLLEAPGGDGGGLLPPGGGGLGGPGKGGSETPSGAPIRGGNRAVGFIRASWAELQRVQWPDRRQVGQATAVVIGFVAIAGAYLGVADYVAKEIVEFIL